MIARPPHLFICQQGGYHVRPQHVGKARPRCHARHARSVLLARERCQQRRAQRRARVLRAGAGAGAGRGRAARDAAGVWGRGGS
jgi:hypothetical protein